MSTRVMAAQAPAISKPGGSGGQAGSVAKRLQNELMSLMMSKPKGISAFPDSDNLFVWRATVEGVKGTVYDGHKYQLVLKFEQNYPYEAPNVKFATPCYHPNVDEYGNICLDILKENWSACNNVSTILLSIQSLLGEPNNDSPLNGHAAALWDNVEAFRELVNRKYAETQAAQK